MFSTGGTAIVTSVAPILTLVLAVGAVLAFTDRFHRSGPGWLRGRYSCSPQPSSSDPERHGPHVLSSESGLARSGQTAESAPEQLPAGARGHAVARAGRRSLVVAGVVGAGLVLLLLGGSLLVRADGTVTPRLVEGWAMPNASGTAISLHPSETGGPGEGYVVAGASWVDADDVRHSGTEAPTCIGTNPRTMTAVQLSVVTVALSDGTQWDHVVHLRCLD